MRARREAELCYNCDIIFLPEHRCKLLFYLWAPSTDVDDNVTPGIEIVDPEKSLYVLASVRRRTSDTMQLTVKVGDVELTALLGNDSTHNFITEETTTKAGVALYATAYEHECAGGQQGSPHE